MNDDKYYTGTEVQIIYLYSYNMKVPESKLKLIQEGSFTIVITYIETEETIFIYIQIDTKKVIKTKIWVLRREEYKRWVYDSVRFGEEDLENWRG